MINRNASASSDSFFEEIFQQVEKPSQFKFPIITSENLTSATIFFERNYLDLSNKMQQLGMPLILHYAVSVYKGETPEEFLIFLLKLDSKLLSGKNTIESLSRLENLNTNKIYFHILNHCPQSTLIHLSKSQFSRYYAIQVKLYENVLNQFKNLNEVQQIEYSIANCNLFLCYDEYARHNNISCVTIGETIINFYTKCINESNSFEKLNQLANHINTSILVEKALLSKRAVDEIIRMIRFKQHITRVDDAFSLPSSAEKDEQSALLISKDATFSALARTIQERVTAEQRKMRVGDRPSSYDHNDRHIKPVEKASNHLEHVELELIGLLSKVNITAQNMETAMRLLDIYKLPRCLSWYEYDNGWIRVHDLSDWSYKKNYRVEELDRSLFYQERIRCHVEPILGLLVKRDTNADFIKYLLDHFYSNNTCLEKDLQTIASSKINKILKVCSLREINKFNNPKKWQILLVRNFEDEIRNATSRHDLDEIETQIRDAMLLKYTPPQGCSTLLSFFAAKPALPIEKLEESLLAKLNDKRFVISRMAC